jgi:septal ring-binding cell division protein DamX
MLKLNAAYSKKVPTSEQYSSQSYHCSVEVELSDAASPEQLQAKIHDTFALVRDAVESELHGKPATKAESAAQPAKAEPQRPDATAKASNKQVKFILDLAKGKGLSLSVLNARVQDKFKVESVYELARKDASRLVDELKAAA